MQTMQQSSAFAIVDHFAVHGGNMCMPDDCCANAVSATMCVVSAVCMPFRWFAQAIGVHSKQGATRNLQLQLRPLQSDHVALIHYTASKIHGCLSANRHRHAYALAELVKDVFTQVASNVPGFSGRPATPINVISLANYLSHMSCTYQQNPLYVVSLRA
jgi:hypothetical protein